MKTLSIFLILILINLPTYSQKKSFDMSHVYPIERSHSYVGFSVEYMGFAKVKGRFADFQGTIIYDQNNIKETSVSFSIDVGSIDTDHDWRDKDLKSAHWFEVDKFPKIYFRSKEVRYTDNGFKLIGDLTIKEVTKVVELEMGQPSGVLTDLRGDYQVIFTGQLTLNRKDYGVEGENWNRVKEGLTAIGSEIAIELSILGKQINKSNYKNWVKNETRPQGKIYKMINEKGVEAAIEEFEKIKALSGDKLNAGALNIAGNMLLKEGRNEEALKLLKANIEAFPDQTNAYDTYAEALVRSGQMAEATRYYKLAVEKDPENQNAREILRHLQR